MLSILTSFVEQDNKYMQHFIKHVAFQFGMLHGTIATVSTRLSHRISLHGYLADDMYLLMLNCDASSETRALYSARSSLQTTITC